MLETCGRIRPRDRLREGGCVIGSAGHGAFLVQGVKLEVIGDADDHVGRGLSGGTTIVRPAVSSPLAS